MGTGNQYIAGQGSELQNADHHEKLSSFHFKGQGLKHLS